MAKLYDKVSYLRGLVEGMNFTETDNQSKLILRIIDALDELSEKIDKMNDNIDELGDYIESVDSDLESLEFGDELDDDDFDEMDDEDEEEDEDEETDDDALPLVDIDDEQDDELGIYEGCLCPECGGIFSVLVNSDEDQQYICPHCEKRVKAVRMNCKNVPVATTFTGLDEE